MSHGVLLMLGAMGIVATLLAVFNAPSATSAPPRFPMGGMLTCYTRAHLPASVVEHECALD